MPKNIKNIIGRKFSVSGMFLEIIHLYDHVD